MQPATRSMRLPDGHAVTLRAMQPGDAARERAFIAALSADSLYRRAFRRMTQATDAEIAQLTQVDFTRDTAIVATHEGPGGEEEFIGVVRYVRDDDPSSAEFAIIVADEWQRHGLGTILFEALVEQAQGHGIRTLHGMVLRSNPAMTGLARSMGFEVTPIPGDATVVNASRALGGP